jgi:membrane-associated phospholipid phosphatase
MQENKNRRLSLLKKISLQTLLFSVLFLVSIGIFAAVAHEVVGENEDWFDTKVFNLLKENSGPATIRFFRIVSFFGTHWFLIPAYAAMLGYLLFRRRKQDAADMVIIIIASSVLMFALKAVYSRNRPLLPLFQELNSYSFPSGHAISSFIFCSVLIFFAWKSRWVKLWKWITAILLILFSLLIGVSRIVLRYHYASDVLAGFCLGFAWVLLCLWIQRKVRTKNYE